MATKRRKAAQHSSPAESRKEELPLYTPEALAARAASFRPRHQEALQQLRKQGKAGLQALHQAHEAAFERQDCLACASCCKTISPTLTSSDVRALGKALRLSEAQLFEQYLRRDEEGDVVMQRTPCPFLGPDNHCSVYHARPTACRRYPHTDADYALSRPGLTEKNAAVCPAVDWMLRTLASDMGL